MTPTRAQLSSGAAMTDEEQRLEEVRKFHSSGACKGAPGCVACFLIAQLDRARAELKLMESDCADGTCRACVRCCDAATQRAERAEADLKSYLADTAVTCAFCEARHERPVTFEDIRAHVSVCPKHPLAAALAQVERLKKVAEAAVQADAWGSIAAWNIAVGLAKAALATAPAKTEEGT